MGGGEGNGMEGVMDMEEEEFYRGERDGRQWGDEIKPG